VRSPAGATTLSASEWVLLHALLRLDPPDALDIAVRRSASPDVRNGLAERGLLHGSDPAPPIASALRRLSRAPLVLDVHRPRPDPLAAVVAVDAARPVLAVRYGETVAVRHLPPERAVDAVLEKMPRLRRASGRAVRVPVAVLTAAVATAGDDAERLVVELMRRGMSGAGARTLVDANRVTVPASAGLLALEIDELVRAAAGAADAGLGQRRGAGRGSTRPADTDGIGSETGAST